MNIESLGVSLVQVSMQIEEETDNVTLNVTLKGPHKRILRLVDWIAEFCDDECKGLDGNDSGSA